MKSFEIYITDLKDEVRENLIKEMGWDGNENYDVFPLFVVEEEE